MGRKIKQLTNVTTVFFNFKMKSLVAIMVSCLLVAPLTRAQRKYDTKKEGGEWRQVLNLIFLMGCSQFLCYVKSKRSVAQITNVIPEGFYRESSSYKFNEL